MDTQTQIERLIELAIVQRSELKQLVSELPQLREYLSAEIERTFEETEPQIRTELEEFCKARASDEHAKTGAALAAKVEELSKQLEVTTAAKYSVLMAERAENVNLLAKAEARIEDAASMLSHAVKEIVTDELSRFPRAGEIDQLRKEFAEPRGLNPRGRWMPDETYQRLDLVTINGDSFVSNIDGNRERPSRTAGDWTLSAARGNGGGGGGVTTMTDLVPVPSNGQLLIGNGSAFVNSTLTAGTGISISNGPGSITINATDGNITLDDGTAAAPSLNFTNEPTTGLFRASANVMGFAVAGTSRATMTATGMTVTGTIAPSGSVHAASGSAGNPSLAFNADQNTGLYNIGADNIGVAAGGAKVLDIATTGLGVTGTLSVSGVATLGAGAILNTPASGTLTNATGLPISTGVSGLGANVAAFLATPSSANLAAALTDETGTGANVFATSPTLTTPISATLTSPAATNLTLGLGTGGTALTLTNSTLAATFAGAVTTGGNLTLPAASAGYRLILTGTNNTGTGQLVIQAGGGSAAWGGTLNLFETAHATKGGYVGVGLGVSGAKFTINSSGFSDSGEVASIDRSGNATFSGAVAISSTTAGSSGAGALVVQGGISAGNTGSAASYFGGAVNAGPVPVDTYALKAIGNTASGQSYGLNIDAGTTSADYSLRIRTATGGNADYFSVRGDGRVTVGSASSPTATITSAGAATFAGAVTSTQFQSDVYRQQSGDRSLLSFSGVETVLGGGTPGDTTKINANGVQALRIDASLLATFAGDVSAQRLEAVDAAANNRAAAFIRTQNNTTYSSSVLNIQGDRTTTNASYNLISAANAAGTGAFAVRDSGNAVNTNNSYGSISDRKLKENIVDATSKLEKLNQVRIVNFNRIGNEQKQLGVIAQELEQIFPSMIEEVIDRDAEGNDLGTTTKSVKYSVFVPMLIKAVQELTARLAAVEAK